MFETARRGFVIPPSPEEEANSSAAAYLEGLNAAQRCAVEHGDGPLLVVAGAGTGKTRTLAARVARLVDSGVAPERILLLTFTRRAAQEMLERAGRMTRSGRAGRVWGGTFHAVGNRLLRTYGASLGLPPNFTVLDQGDAADLMNLIRNELDLGRGRRRFPKKDTLASVYSRSVNAGTKLVEVVEKHYPWCRDDVEDMARIFTAYTERKRLQGTLDFDDLLLYWLALMRSGAGRTVSELFDHVLVDEYQDTNGVQADILRALRSSNANIMVVGDDAQSIYSFRAATVNNILDFPQHFPDTTVVKLEKNYRSTQPVLDVSNAVIAQARKRFEKELYCERIEGLRPALFTCRDEAQQSDAVCDAVLGARERGVALRHQAVLFRTGHHSAHLEIELTRRNVPFVKYGGLRFVESAHVRDVLALLRIVENPHDELAWFRVLQLIEGVGPSTAGRVMEALGVRVRNGGPPSMSPLRRLREQPPPLPNPARRHLAELGSALGDVGGRPEPGPGVEIDRLRAWYEPNLERVYDNAPARVADLVQLEQIASGYGSRAHFIADLALDPPTSTGELAGPPLLDEDYLILSTIHSAKGCEWDSVYLIHAADGMLPSDMATGDEAELAEERRLLYVALTRARNELHVYWPLRYYHRRLGASDAHSYAQLTRFIDEEVRALFDQRCLAPEEEARLPDNPHPGVQAITDFLADLFEL